MQTLIASDRARPYVHLLNISSTILRLTQDPILGGIHQAFFRLICVYGLRKQVANRTHVLRSDDRGASWREIAVVDDQYWSTLFLHKDAVYLLGTTSDGFVSESSICISRSADGGYTWRTQVPSPSPHSRPRAPASPRASCMACLLAW